jgi:UDP-N-acetylmuramate dehydrogenase
MGARTAGLARGNPVARGERCLTVSSLAIELKASLPDLRGRLVADAPLKDITWFRVGGAADVLYTPVDEADLAYFMAHVPAEVPVFVIGLCSNLLVRDGGARGVVIRLGRGFGEIEVLDGTRLRAGTAVPDVRVARAAADAGIAGLSFYRGIPGGIGGALRMNAGAHGSETKDVLLSARAVDRQGRVHELTNANMGFTYRRSAAPRDWIFTSATFEGTPGEPEEIVRAMDEVAGYREKHQPIKERTGGSTFKNPPDNSAWKLIDAAGCRGLRVGGAMVSDMHCNFLINVQQASAEDIERLGETVRARVRAASGIELHWEIVRVGEAVPGRAIGAALATEHAP